MARQFLRAELDFHYSSECPACSEVAGWMGETEVYKNGWLGVKLACPHCCNQFVNYASRYNKEFSATPKPVFTPGREVPRRFVQGDGRKPG